MSDEDKSTIYVPSKHLGLIIGKGGSRIKEISEECGCRINIKKDQANGDEVPIVLEGSEKNIDRAKSKIEEITRRDRKRAFDDDNDRDNGYSNKRYGGNNNYNSNNNNRNDNGYDRNQSTRSGGGSYGNGGQWKSNNGDRGSDGDSGDERQWGKQSSGRDRDRDRDRDSWGQSRHGDSGNNRDNWGSSGGGGGGRSYGSASRAVNSDDWGGWGKKSDESVPLDSLIFSGNDSQYNSNSNSNRNDRSRDRDFHGSSNNGGSNTTTYGGYQDDDWGIPTSLEEEKPERKRPENAALKMKSSRDSAFYPVHKYFYREHPNVARMSVEEKDEFLKFKNNIMIKELQSEGGASFCNFGDTKFEKDPEELIEELEVSKTIPNPIRTFEEAFFDHPDILREIRKQKFDEPSPIQCIAWPVLMSGRDFIGIAQTGTGKTLAFLLPAFIHIEGQPKPRERRQGPTVLILSPTRELAIQIQNEVQKYTYHDIDSVVCYGGADKRDQIYQLKENPEIVVGTPGRIQDLKDSGVLHLKDVSYLVLDEADRMLDMGFELQVVNLIYAVRKQRQTVMTSATWPFGVQRIALNHMRDPVQVNVGTLDLNACHTVKQYVEYVEYHDKTARLVEILSNIKPEDKIIIFVARKAQCSELAFDLYLKRSKGLLGKKGAVRACEIHGDLDQQEREMALRMMRSGQRNVMIATDVASRGLDIVDLTKVINYDFPKNIEEYVHRVGRTGRAGRTGEAFTFMNKMDWSNATELIKILQDGDQEVPDFLPNLMREYQEYRITGGSRGRFGGGGRGGRGRGGGGGSGGYNGGGGGYNGDRDRDRDRDRDGGGQRRGGNHRANRFDDNMEDVLTDSSWPDTTNSSVTPFKAISQNYVENDLSDEETWGNWNVTLINKEKEQDNKIINEEKIVEIPLRKANVIVSTNKRFSTTPYLLGNKDRNIYPIHRNFYEEHPVVKELSMSDIESFLLKKNNIMIQELKTYPNQLTDNHDIMTDDIDEDQIEILAGNPGIPKPIRTFEEMFWNQTEILDIIESLKFESPSPIQCVGWPVIMGGRDFIGIAQTGTGKTLTFVLPALIHIEGQIKPRQYRRGPTVLILSPTRELALQIENEILKIKYRGIKSVCCYGGAEKNSQINSLRENPEIVVGTPGRINDLLLMGCLCLKDVSYLVLDEADRMLDMGFEPQVVCIINETRKQRQTIMTSATWPEIVRQIALLYMDNPIQVNVGSLDLIACNAVVQEIRYVNNFSKTDELITIISEMDKDDKIIVFVTRKIQCRSLTKHLERLVSKNQLGPYANICEIHGDLSQEQREQSLYWFRNGQCTVLVATNVASRGLDIADITCVVNYDFPKDIEEYVHRVGRTGRAGKTGRAITFMNEADWKYSFDLKNILIQSDQIVPPWLTNLKYMKITEQLNQSQNCPDENPPSRRNFKTTIKNHWSSFDCNYDDDYDDYDGTEIDFFDHYQQQYDSKNFIVESQTEEVSNWQNEMENNSQENPKEKEDSRCIVEQVIEYRSDFYSELYEQEDESDFFSEYQQQIDPQSEKMPVDEAVNEDEMEYESEDQYEAWW